MHRNRLQIYKNLTASESKDAALCDRTARCTVRGPLSCGELVPRAAWPPFPTSGRSGSHSSLADRYILSEIDRLSPLKYLLSQGTLRTLQQGEGEGLCSCFCFCMSGGLGRQSLYAWHIAGTAAGSADASTASSAQFFHPPCWKLC